MPPDEDQLSLRQADQIRGDLYGIQDSLDFIKVQLALLPTRNEVCANPLFRRSLGHAYLLEFDGGRLALRDRVHSRARLVLLGTLLRGESAATPKRSRRAPA
jgi:hypothetical protein